MEVELIKFEEPEGSLYKTVFLSNLSPGVTNQMIKAIFLEFGAIYWVYLNENEDEDSGGKQSLDY